MVRRRLVAQEYNMSKEELIVTIHEAKGLPGADLPDPPDPYVKLYMLPERSKKSKKKSDVKKDTVSPIYDETFEVCKHFWRSHCYFSRLKNQIIFIQLRLTGYLMQKCILFYSMK